MEQGIRFLFITIGFFGITKAALAQSVRYPVLPYNVTSSTCDFMGECDMTGLHMAEDVSASAGTPVYAPAAGTIKEKMVHDRYGTVVLLEAQVNNETVVFLMGHMRQVGLQVNTGQVVSKGQLLGYIGTNMGDRASPYDNGGWPDHLHFGVHKGAYNSSTSCTGAWTYAGYETAECGYDDWYDPTNFIASSAIQAKADELWGIKPYGGSDCEDGLICEEPPGGDIHWYVNAADPFLIEDWEGGTWGGIAITYDPDTNQTDHAYVLRHGFLEYYLNSGGPDLFGPPLGDELDQTQENVYEAYDPYCSGELGYSEPEGCIELFCGSSRTYTSVQRFEHTTLCWDPSVGVVCDPQNANREVCDQAESTWSASSSSYGGVSTSEGNLWVYDSTIYWVHNGYTHGIVSSEMFEACGFSWSEPYPVSEDVFNSLPQGDTVHDPVSCGAVVDGTLVDQGGTVYEYWAEDASWHGYPSTLVFDACLNDWSSIQEMSSSVFSTITIGSVIGNSVDCGVLSPGDLVHWNGTVYRITPESLKRGFTSSDVFNACGYDWDLITYLTDEEYPLVTTLQDGSAISSTSDCSNITGDLVHWEWTGTIYYLTGTGYKRGVTSTEAMTSCGFDWNQVRYVSTNNGAVVWTLGDEAAITGNGDCP